MATALKLIFDLQALQNGSRQRGIGRYCLNLFESLARSSEIELYALLNDAFADQIEEQTAMAAALVGEENVMILRTLSPSAEIEEANLSRRAVNERLYEELLGSIEFDVLLVGSLVEGLTDNTVTSLRNPYRNYRSSVILYDLIPLLNQEQFLGWDKSYNWYFDRLAHMKRADLLLSISDYARLEAMEHAGFDGDRVTAIGTAADQDIFSPGAPEASDEYLRDLGITKPFVMHASALEERKNFDGLIRAFASMPRSVRQRHQLLLIGRSEHGARERLLDLAGECGLRDGDVILPGYVSDQELAGLYRRCSLFVFPSFHEGFGLPALEAMCSGCPTIGSNRSSIPEVIGRDDLLFDPSDVDGLAKLMADILSDRARQQDLRDHAGSFSPKFSWESVAARAVEALQGLSRSSNAAAVSLERSARAVADSGVVPQLEGEDRCSLASALVANEQEAYRLGALWCRGGRRSWRIEGPFDSSYSLALLNRETARALADIGFDVILHSTEGPGDFEANPYYLTMHPDLAEFHSKAGKKKAKTSDCVTRLLYPPRVHDIEGKRRGLHHYAWEETGFNQDWVEEFNSSLTFMTCLSRQVEKIMIDNGVTVPLLTSGCGVDHWERVESAAKSEVDARAFKFLHVSSCFPRKALDTLLAAYGEAFSASDDVSLIIKTFENPHNDVEDQLAALKAGSSIYPHVVIIKDDLSEGELKALYEACDVLVGPSCGEGFGLPLAEAMLSGLPVITTNWGGQLDFCNPRNSWLVDYKFEPAQTHFGLWNSAWARPRLESLRDAMINARQTPRAERFDMARRGRQQLLATHGWKDAARRLATAANQLPDTRGKDAPRIGWFSTWNSKCGIAEYSRHLVEGLQLPVTVFAPHNEERLSTEEDCIRAWSISKTEGRLCEILDGEGADCDAFVIQFNYNFYDHSDLSEFVRCARKADKAVVIALHSTVDPPEHSRSEEFFLEYLAPALRLCDRILVHAISDLNRLKELGLVDNVALFPHGVVEAGEFTQPRREAEDLPVIGTYGFALPQKGLEEIIAACALLKKQGRPVRLKMVNAEYPADVSRDLISELEREAEKAGISDLVEAHHAFLPSEESLALLRECDLIVFPYQRTGESSSAAVRYGLASGVPVAVTPLPIFGDVQGAVYSLLGGKVHEIASGIREILGHIDANDELSQKIGDRAQSWQEAHGYSKVSRRLANICTALASAASRRSIREAPEEGSRSKDEASKPKKKRTSRRAQQQA